MSPVVAHVDDDPLDFIVSSRGLSEIDTLAIHEKLKSLNLRDSLKINSQEEGFSKTTKVLDQLEYTFWDWLAANNSPSWLNEGRLSIGITSSGGGITPKVGSEMTKILILNQEIFKNNPLFELEPIKIALPSGAKVIRESYDNIRKITLETDHAIYEIKIAFAGGGVFDSMINKVTQKIASQYVADPSLYSALRMSSYNFSFEWNFKLRPISRFADVSKFENEWYEIISKRFNYTFSWENLRERILKR